MIYVCKKCGSPHIHVAMWANPNTNKVQVDSEPLFDFNQAPKNVCVQYCDTCDEECEITEKEGSMDDSSKLWAIFHDGTFQGDNLFTCPGSMIEYKQGQSYEEVRDAFIDDILKQDGFNPDTDNRQEWMEEYGWQETAGAWVVTGEQKDMIELVWESDPHNDSAVYQCNYSAKMMAERCCIKHLGKKPG